jgi:hypothetical protein
MTSTSGRSVMTDAAAPVSGTAANSVDAIFVPIEAHQRAEEEFSAALRRLSGLENELPKERRRSEINMGLLAIVSEDDPMWVEVQKTVLATHKTTGEAATQLLNTRPTTLAGVVAVLRYAYDYERHGLDFPGGYDDGDLSECPGGGGVVGVFPPQSRPGDRDHNGPRGPYPGLTCFHFAGSDDQARIAVASDRTRATLI